MITPLHLELLMHYYTSEAKFRHENETIQKYRQHLIDDGSLKPCPQRKNGYLVTDVGRAWITVILSTPLPTVAYVNAAGKIIDSAQEPIP